MFNSIISYLRFSKRPPGKKPPPMNEVDVFWDAAGNKLIAQFDDSTTVPISGATIESVEGLEGALDDLQSGIDGKQPLKASLTAYGEEIEVPVVSNTLNLSNVESDIITVNPYAETDIDAFYMPSGCKKVTLRFLGAIYFGPVGVDAETGDVMEVVEIDGSFRIVSHVRADGTSPADVSDPGAFRALLEQGYESVKGAMVINAKDYGVVANGTTDDTTALQAAVTAAANNANPSILILPPGTIKITTEVTIPGSVIIRGAGGLRTKIQQFTAGANGLVATQAHYHMGFEDFTLLGPDATTGDGQATGVGLLMDHKVYPGQYIGGPVHIKNMSIARWYCPLRVAQIHLLVENTRIGSYTKGVILMSTDVFLFHGCAIGAETELGPTVTTCTSITMLGATLDPPNVTSGGGNFAGTFLATEIGGAWRILETDDQAKVRFESCNVECGNSFSGGSDKLFAIKAGARVEVSNCRFGIAFTTGESGTETTPTPASIFGCDATNAAANSKLVLRNNTIDSGSFYNVLKIVGDQWGDNYPEVYGKSAVNLKAYNAAGTLKSTIPSYSQTFVSRDRIYMEFSTPPTHAASVTRRGLFNIRQADDGDSTAGDDVLTFTRKKRTTLAGVVQYGRDYLLPCMLSEVLVSSSTTTANGASATETALPATTIPNGQLIGNGDRFKIEFRGTCVANANTKTLEYLYGGDSYASLTITDATAVAWVLTVDVFGDAASILRGSVSLVANDASGNIVINKRVRVSKGSSDGDKAISMKVNSPATSDITTEGWICTWTNGAKKY